MTESREEVRRLWQVLRLVEREDHHLCAVRERLFGSLPDRAIDGAWVADTLASAEGVDRLESFGAKFGRMQDTIVDKLLPRFLEAVGEHPGAAIDNLNRAERLELIHETDDWLEMRRLRNRLVHEYIENPADMAPALRRARAFVDELHETYSKIRAYCETHFE